MVYNLSSPPLSFTPDLFSTLFTKFTSSNNLHIALQSSQVHIPKTIFTMHFSPVILLALFASVNAQGFFSTCVEFPVINLSGSVLETACQREDTSAAYTNIDLNGCISNYFGTLIVCFSQISSFKSYQSNRY
jgi:hypothetical protein